jgi:hypothetical protein
MSEPVVKKTRLEPREVIVRGKYTSKFGNISLVSAEDFDRVNEYYWNWSNQGYARTHMKINGKTKNVKMSRFVLNCDAGEKRLVDHINGIKHDNRRENLRLSTPKQNSQNKTKAKGRFSSDYYGVVKKKGKYLATIKINGIQLSLGTYDKEKEAAQIYDRFVIMRPETAFCKLNFPEKREEYLKLPSIEVKSRSGHKKFKYIKKECQKYRATFIEQGNRINLGLFQTEEEGAFAIDEYIVEHKLQRSLSFPERFPDYQAPIVLKFDCLDIDETTSKLVDVTNGDNEVDVILRFNSGKSYTIIERNDLDKVSRYNMVVTKKGYINVYIADKCKQIALHRYLLDAPDDKIVDHIDGNPIDNRKRFLRVVTNDINARNRKKNTGNLSSKFIGVSRKEKKWRASVGHDGFVVLNKTVHDEEVAARLRDLFVIIHYPNEYGLNFSDWSEETISEWKVRLKADYSELKWL